MAANAAANGRMSKRIIVCCDGTWMDCDNGYTKPTWIPYHPNAVLQIPSNVTRIARAFRRVSRDGKHQIIYYHSGVGTGQSFLDTIFGGLLGTGISENIRESYSFITTNYKPGDEIVLIGFSRGAFTARAIAGLITDIGLLTREGMKDFFAIFKDNTNINNKNYVDIFPTVPFKDKPKGLGAVEKYRDMLVENGLTRVDDPEGKRITISAIGVWDTVGSLGIPNLTMMDKLGLPHSTKEFKFHDTALSTTIKHAFQALALDEHREPFSPAIWERVGATEGTDLRQVWFPGGHGSVGGGYPDQEIANIALAWMMDQLSSIGISFKDSYLDLVYAESKTYYENLPPPKPSCCVCAKPEKPWAQASIYEKCHPVRPFGLGKIYESETGVWILAGEKIRTPGMFKKINPDTGKATKSFLSQTNERIHSSVRLRFALAGRSVDDKSTYTAYPLTKCWAPKKIEINVYDPIGEDAGMKWGNNDPMPSDKEIKGMASDAQQGNKEPGNPGTAGVIAAAKKKWFGGGDGATDESGYQNIPEAAGNRGDGDDSGNGLGLDADNGISLAGDLDGNDNGSRVVLDGDNRISFAGDLDADNRISFAGDLDGNVEENSDGSKYRWVWEYEGKEKDAPKERVMIEENMGPYQRRLLALDECKEISQMVLGAGAVGGAEGGVGGDGAFEDEDVGVLRGARGRGGVGHCCDVRRGDGVVGH